MIKEIQRKCASGYWALVVLPLLLIGNGWWLVNSIIGESATGVVLSILVAIALLICLAGFFMVHPNEAKVLQLFGTYVGSVRATGLRWANPFYSKESVSLRVRNFESGQMKVNDSSGNPIEIAAVVVWKVVDSAEAMFEVDDYESFVQIQSEAALRNMAMSYPYEIHGDEVIALRSHPQEIAERLREEVQERLDKAGVKVIEMLPAIAPFADKQMSGALERALAAQGFEFNLESKVTEIALLENGARVSFEDKDGNSQKVECDKVLVAAGRKPCTDGLALDEAGVKLDETGRIVVDDKDIARVDPSALRRQIGLVAQHTLLLNGKMLTGRDAAHKKMVDMLANGETYY